MLVKIGVEVPHLSARIKAAVDASSKSPTVIAGMSGMSVANLYRIMNKDAKSIPRDTLRRLSEVLEVDFDADVRSAMLSELESG